MMEGVSIAFGIIWIIIVVSIISRIAKGASNVNKAQQQARARMQQQFGASAQQQERQVYDAQQENLDRIRRLDQSRTAGRAQSGSYSQSSQYNRAYGSKPVDVKTSSVLLEDRRNDWLAQQLREEAASKRRFSSDLGASHEAECAADDLRRDHRKRHNTTGINRSTFR